MTPIGILDDVTGLAMGKPWITLTSQSTGAVPAQLGVFELGDADQNIVYVGYAGGRELFGLRSALDAALAGTLDDLVDVADLPELCHFRYEVTHAYLTRWEELLMVHRTLHGTLPVGNADHPYKLGRLSVG
jgi:hypothetical protein